jgi:hypothetical protein
MQTFEGIKIKPDTTINNMAPIVEDDLTNITKPEIIIKFKLAKSDDPFSDDNAKGPFASTVQLKSIGIP